MPEVMESLETKWMEFREAEAECAPHIGRGRKGCTVGIEALASPTYI